MSNNHKNILIIGPIPEPKGGVSIHIMRLQSILKNDFNIKFVDESPILKQGIYNIRSKNILEYIRLLLWADVVHIHSGIRLLRCFHIIMATILLKKTVVTIHSFTTEHTRNFLFSALIIKLCNRIIVVNNEIPKVLKLNDFILKPAFIPPDLKEEKKLPTSIINWVNTQRKKSNTILAANAFRICFHKGNDLYGIDLCIEMVRKFVKDKKENISLIFVISSLSKSCDQYEQYQQLIDEYGLTDNILLIQENISFVKLIEEVDIILRPTCTDGDALTIREALFLGKPVIASDVIERPTGTILFKNRDCKDFSLKVIEFLNDPVSVTEHNQKEPEYKNFYKKLYLDI